MSTASATTNVAARAAQIARDFLAQQLRRPSFLGPFTPAPRRACDELDLGNSLSWWADEGRCRLWLVRNELAPNTINWQLFDRIEAGKRSIHYECCRDEDLTSRLEECLAWVGESYAGKGDALWTPLRELWGHGAVPVSWAVRSGQNPDWLRELVEASRSVYALAEFADLLGETQVQFMPIARPTATALPSDLCGIQHSRPGRRPVVIDPRHPRDVAACDGLRALLEPFPAMPEVMDRLRAGGFGGGPR